MTPYKAELPRLYSSQSWVLPVLFLDYDGKVAVNYIATEINAIKKDKEVKQMTATPRLIKTVIW